MKPSQVLLLAAHNIEQKILNEEIHSIFGCLEIQKALGNKVLSTSFNSIEVEYYKQFGNPFILRDKNNTTWFNSHFTETYILEKDLNNMRIIALCFASYIAELDGN